MVENLRKDKVKDIAEDMVEEVYLPITSEHINGFHCQSTNNLRGVCCGGRSGGGNWVDPPTPHPRPPVPRGGGQGHLGGRGDEVMAQGLRYEGEGPAAKH